MLRPRTVRWIRDPGRNTPLSCHGSINRCDGNHKRASRAACGADAPQREQPLSTAALPSPPQATSHSGSSGRVCRSGLTQPPRLKSPSTSGKGQGLKDESKKSGSLNTQTTEPLGADGQCGSLQPEAVGPLSLKKPVSSDLSVAIDEPLMPHHRNPIG